MRRKICHSGRHDQRMRVLDLLHDRLMHLLGLPDSHYLAAVGRLQIGGRGDQGNVGAGIQRGLGQGIALFAGRPVGDHAHRVDGLLRSAAVTTIFLPASEPPRDNSQRIYPAMSSLDSNRPGPTRPEARWPSAGPMK